MRFRFGYWIVYPTHQLIIAYPTHQLQLPSSFLPDTMCINGILAAQKTDLMCRMLSQCQTFFFLIQGAHRVAQVLLSSWHWPTAEAQMLACVGYPCSYRTISSFLGRSLSVSCSRAWRGWCSRQPAALCTGLSPMNSNSKCILQSGRKIIKGLSP